jgi:hypothetical protein
MSCARPRSARAGRPGSRPASVGVKRLTAAERAELRRHRAELRRAGVYRRRPQTWGECARRRGPCGFVSCRYNLYLDVDEVTGAVKVNFPDLEIDELPETCALRAAARGGLSNEEVGKLLNVTDEWVRQIEQRGLIRARRLVRGTPLREPSPASRKSTSR